MKANEAPEKIYISLISSILGGYVYITVNKDFPNAVEYTCTDSFIEKACEYFAPHISDNSGGYDKTRIIEDFKNYMKGE
jgi:hypothetical protein